MLYRDIYEQRRKVVMGEPITEISDALQKDYDVRAKELDDEDY